KLETELARSIGPIAAVVVRNAAKKAQTIAALAEAVAREIEDEAARAAFQRKFAGGEVSRPTTVPPQPAASISQKFSEETLKGAERALAQYIGAIAKVVVKRAAGTARDEAELYLLIADEIKDPAERKAFVRKAVSTSRR